MLFLFSIVFSFCAAQVNLNLEAIENNVKLSVENHESQPFKFLSWGTPFEKEGLTHDAYLVQRTYKESASYLGYHAFRAEPTDDHYVTVPPFSTVEAVIDLSRYYHITKDGEYRVSLTLPCSNELYPFQNNVSTIIKFTKSHVVASKNVYRSIVKRAGEKTQEFQCNDKQTRYVKDAYRGAVGGAQRALKYVQNRKDYGNYYGTWFGQQYSPDRYNTVLDVFGKLSPYLSQGQYNFDCNNTKLSSFCRQQGFYAYAEFADGSHTIHFCLFYFKDVSVKFRAVIHELTHFNDLGARKDVAYGAVQCQTLAATNPDRAVLNADNYAFFADSQF